MCVIIFRCAAQVYILKNYESQQLKLFMSVVQLKLMCSSSCSYQSMKLNKKSPEPRKQSYKQTNKVRQLETKLHTNKQIKKAANKAANRQTSKARKLQTKLQTNEQSKKAANKAANKRTSKKAANKAENKQTKQGSCKQSFK